jgi:hypothetical protein
VAGPENHLAQVALRTDKTGSVGAMEGDYAWPRRLTFLLMCVILLQTEMETGMKRATARKRNEQRYRGSIPEPGFLSAIHHHTT